jgi:rare lipoprotein A (peptidoglycan hydrolase)
MGHAYRWYGWPDVRRPKVVAIAALIAAFATVAVPGPVGSRAPSTHATPSTDLFASVEIASVRGPTMTTPPLDPGARSNGNLDESSTLFEPDLTAEPPQARPKAAQPQATAGAIKKNTWRLDRNVSWYGPGFYGKRTACGQTMSQALVGVAHRTLPCGTKVTFKNPANGRIVTAPVVDRGPYVSGRQWDLTGGLCLKLGHCYTGPISWKYAKR